MLSAELRPLTAGEIYDEIIEQGLYVFGAQNPINVVRNTIESACDNSSYSEKHRVAVPCFHFERNDEGKRIYSLLETEKKETSKTQNSKIEKISTPSERSFNIWDCKVEKEFKKWLDHENYAKRTADIYRRATSQIFCNYTALAQKAVADSSNQLEAVRKYISMLSNDSSFVNANSTRHNQFTAALAALERFFSSDRQTTDKCNDELANSESEMINVSTSSFHDIVDLDEGKDGIREILEVHFQTLYGYSNINILWNAVQDNLSMFLNDNAINNADGLFSPISPGYDFEKAATINLTRKEAEFLADKIAKAAMTKNTLLAFLIKNRLNCNSFDEIPADILPDELRRDYLLAKDFSDFIIGAHYRYNIIFSNYQDEDMMDEFNLWRNMFKENRGFDLDVVLDRISCNYPTKKFCKNFFDSVYEDDMQTMDELIIAREKAVKADRAKLCKPKEYQYSYDRPVHYYRLDYRFGTAKTIIDDIIKGLER